MSPTSYRTAPSRDISIMFIGAGDRNRTGTTFKGRRILSPVRLPVPPLRPAYLLALGVGLEPTTYRLTAGCSAIELPKSTTGSFTTYVAWQLPTLPGRFHPSTIGVKRLNFCVRYGNRCIPLAIVTRRKLKVTI